MSSKLVSRSIRASNPIDVDAREVIVHRAGDPRAPVRGEGRMRGACAHLDALRFAEARSLEDARSRGAETGRDDVAPVRRNVEAVRIRLGGPKRDALERVRVEH